MKIRLKKIENLRMQYGKPLTWTIGLGASHSNTCTNPVKTGTSLATGKDEKPLKIR